MNNFFSVEILSLKDQFLCNIPLNFSPKDPSFCTFYLTKCPIENLGLTLALMFYMIVLSLELTPQTCFRYE